MCKQLIVKHNITNPCNLLHWQDIRSFGSCGASSSAIIEVAVGHLKLLCVPQRLSFQRSSSCSSEIRLLPAIIKDWGSTSHLTPNNSSILVMHRTRAFNTSYRKQPVLRTRLLFGTAALVLVGAHHSGVATGIQSK